MLITGYVWHKNKCLYPFPFFLPFSGDFVHLYLLDVHTRIAICNALNFRLVTNLWHLVMWFKLLVLTSNLFLLVNLFSSLIFQCFGLVTKWWHCTEFANLFWPKVFSGFVNTFWCHYMCIYFHVIDLHFWNYLLFKVDGDYLFKKGSYYLKREGLDPINQINIFVSVPTQDLDLQHRKSWSCF